MRYGPKHLRHEWGVDPAAEHLSHGDSMLDPTDVSIETTLRARWIVLDGGARIAPREQVAS